MEATFSASRNKVMISRQGRKHREVHRLQDIHGYQHDDDRDRNVQADQHVQEKRRHGQGHHEQNSHHRNGDDQVHLSQGSGESPVFLRNARHLAYPPDNQLLWSGWT